MSEEPGRPDQVVAQEYWDNFTARNRSIIVDLMYGQLKSTVVCQTCGEVATAFDPYLSIQLPIEDPRDRDQKMKFHFVPHEMHDYEDEVDLYSLKTMPIIEITVTNNTTIMDIKRQLNESLKLEKLDPDEMVVATFQNGRLTNYIGNYILCKDIEPRAKVLIYHTPKESKEYIAAEMNWFKAKPKVKQDVVNKDGSFVSKQS